MSLVTVFSWSKYDITTDTERVSHRMGTREAITRHNGTVIVIEGTGAEINASLVGLEVDGMTLRDFRPTRTAGEQRQIIA